MQVTQITSGRFHHFHLARQLEKHGLLNAIYTGYPHFKLKDELGIPKSKIKTFPWLHGPYMKRGVLKLDKFKWLNKEWAWQHHELLDKHVAKNIKDATIILALSGSGLRSGKKAQVLGGKYVCDRGSSHIRYQDKILSDEYQRWGLKFKGVDKRIIEKEEHEYEQADFITVPSEFVKSSFINEGVPENKIIKIPYGARLDRFKKIGDPKKNKFRVLWVGGISIRKGFFYALEAFQKLEHPNKEFVVIGSIFDEMKPLLSNFKTTNVSFLGIIPNQRLLEYYSSSNVFILPSIEEGLAMVQGEALACGCPIIATPNTGASDLFTDGKEGFIVPLRSVQALTDKLQLLADNPNMRDEMSENGLNLVKSLNGWDKYGYLMG
jgi:starch synthase